jgi:uncharacterized protein
MGDPIQSDARIQRFLDYPYGVSSLGAPNLTNSDDHLRDLILQVLFTNPGERVNLPEFGCGVQQLVFLPNSDTLRTSTQFLIFNSLQRWLGDRIDTGNVTVTSEPGEEETVMIEIAYVIKTTQQRQSIQVQF